MRFPVRAHPRSIVYDHSPINPTSIYSSPLCRSHRLDPARWIAKLSWNKLRGGLIRFVSKYSFRCLLSSYFIILVVTSPPSSSSNITGSSRFPKREEERCGRVTLFPISLTSLERAPPLAPPCPIIPVNHVDKEGTITLDQILDSSGERNSSLSSMQSSRVGKRRSTGLDAVETPKLRINTSFQTLRRWKEIEQSRGPRFLSRSRSSLKDQTFTSSINNKIPVK